MNESDSRRRAEEYCRKYEEHPKFDNLLGTGQEGFVWATSRNTAIKVFDRISNFDRELGCYLIFRDHGLFEIDSFAIPELVGFDELLRVIELSIVSPPYVLDFGKCYINWRPEFDESTMEYYDSEREEMFEGNWGLVQEVISTMEIYGVFYADARPSNIDCTGHPRSVSKGGA